MSVSVLKTLYVVSVVCLGVPRSWIQTTLFIEKDCMCTTLTLLLSLSHNNTILITESIYIVLWSFGGVYFFRQSLVI